MPEFISDESHDATVPPPGSHSPTPPQPSGSVSNSGGSAAPSNSSARHRNTLRDTWLDQIREQFDDLSTGLQDRILNLIQNHHPGTPTGENRWYYGSYNLSIAFNFYDGTAGPSVSSSPEMQAIVVIWHPSTQIRRHQGKARIDGLRTHAENCRSRCFACPSLAWPHSQKKRPAQR